MTFIEFLDKYFATFLVALTALGPYLIENNKTKKGQFQKSADEYKKVFSNSIDLIHSIKSNVEKIVYYQNPDSGYTEFDATSLTKAKNQLFDSIDSLEKNVLLSNVHVSNQFEALRKFAENLINEKASTGESLIIANMCDQILKEMNNKYKRLS